LTFTSHMLEGTVLGTYRPQSPGLLHEDNTTCLMVQLRILNKTLK
jgi:hypothetical protein